MSYIQQHSLIDGIVQLGFKICLKQNFVLENLSKKYVQLFAFIWVYSSL